MKEIPEKAFTRRLVPVGNNTERLFELCISSEAEFKQMVQPLVHKVFVRGKQRDIEAANRIIIQEGFDVALLSKYSPMEHWLSVYWQLYLHSHFIIAYAKAGKKGLRFVQTHKIEQKYML